MAGVGEGLRGVQGGGWGLGWSLLLSLGHLAVSLLLRMGSQFL